MFRINEETRQKGTGLCKLENELMKDRTVLQHPSKDFRSA